MKVHGAAEIWYIAGWPQHVGPVTINGSVALLLLHILEMRGNDASFTIHGNNI